jgi:hypothetical protein
MVLQYILEHKAHNTIKGNGYVVIFALLTTFSWAFADLFYKKGAVPDDKESHIKTVIMVGLVMGIHVWIHADQGRRFFSGLLVRYFPVSFSIFCR